MRMWLVLLLSSVFAHAAAAADDYAFVLDARFAVGDDAGWAAPGFDDSSWEAGRVSRADPQGRLLWMRAQVSVPEGLDSAVRPVGVVTSGAASWDLYWNGVLVGSNGMPAANAREEVPGRIEHEVFVPPDLIRAGPNLLAMRLSTQNLSLRLGAPLQSVLIHGYGETPGPLSRGTLALLAAGPLLLGAIYFLTMFLLDRRDRSSLLLSMLAFAVLGQLVSETWRTLYSYPYPLHVLRLQTVLTFAAIGALLLVAYVGHEFARKRTGTALVAVASVIGALVAFAPGFDGKTALTLQAGILASSVLALHGVLRRVPGATLALAGIAAAWVTLTLDFGRFIDLSWFHAITALLLLLFVRQAALLRRAQRQGAIAEMRAVQLELELLKQKIQPHFLMNTLTALSEWIESSPQTGVRMIDALAAEFRAVAAISGEKLVPLRLELDLCRNHLAVMGFRGDQTYELHEKGLDPDAPVPPAIFHTLIENALTHNRYARGARFTLEQRVEAGERVYRLRSPLERTDSHSGSGHGHAYVRARLRDAFGERWRFEAGASAGEWVDEIAVPCGS